MNSIVLAINEFDYDQAFKYEINEISISKISHQIQIYNNSTKTVTGNLYVPIINNITARHQAYLFDILSPKPPDILNDNSGNTYAFWESLHINKKENLTIELGYYVISFNLKYLINFAPISTYNINSSLYQKYTKSEQLIQSENSKIISKARQITFGTTNINEKAKKIFDFVSNNLEYSMISEEKGALWALENGIGDCSEHTLLFVALSRAIGIPARVNIGFALPPTIKTTQNGHMWAEYYIDEYGWIPVDVSWNLFNEIDHYHFLSSAGTSEMIPYSNFLFNYTGPKIISSQTFSSEFFTPSAFTGGYEEKLVKTFKQIKNAKFASNFANIFGSSLFSHNETKQVDFYLQKSQSLLQEVVDKLPSDNDVTLIILNALENAKYASTVAWTYITKVLFLVISSSICFLLFLFLKRIKWLYS
jgi:hypothetical protein